MMNNGIKHKLTNENFRSDLSECTYYFDNQSNQNSLRAILSGDNKIIFNIKEIKNKLDIYIKIPNNTICNHHKNGKLINSIVSSNAHLSYHGSPKRKKISGEIHIKNNENTNPLAGQSDKTEAPIASSSDIKIHPLPICRIEFCDVVPTINTKTFINNYFSLKSGAVYFNTIEVHLARRGYLYDLANANRYSNRPDIYPSLFVHTNLHIFITGQIRRRPGLFPQALALQTGNFELIVLATHEYQNSKYSKNSLHYFHTKDFFQEITSRFVIPGQGGWFISSLRPSL